MSGSVFSVSSYILVLRFVRYSLTKVAIGDIMFAKVSVAIHTSSADVGALQMIFSSTN